MTAPCPYVDATTFDDVFAHAHVKRYHTENTRDQRLSEHCHRVTLLAVKLLYEMQRQSPDLVPPDTELGIYRYALIHEVSEVNYGDVPAHVKVVLREQYGVEWNDIADREHWRARNVQEAPTPASLVKALVSLADTIEGKVVSLTIPAGAVRDEVLNSWYSIFNKRLGGFVKNGIVTRKFADYVHELYTSNLNQVDPAWY